MSRASFAYVYARMQARLPLRLSAQEWQMLESSHGFARCLDVVARTSLATALGAVETNSDAHAVEAALRQVWRGQVREAAAWVPANWRGATLWIAHLPFLSRAAATAPPVAWLGREVMTDLPGVDASDPAASWYQGWRTRASGAEPGGTDALFFHYLGPDVLPNDPKPEPDLARSLIRVFRTNGPSPEAVLAWLGLVALDLDRLRGILTHRLCFPPSRRPLAA